MRLLEDHEGLVSLNDIVKIALPRLVLWTCELVRIVNSFFKLIQKSICNNPEYKPVHLNMVHQLKMSTQSKLSCEKGLDSEIIWFHLLEIVWMVYEALLEHIAT
uniref:CSON000291 protein n=1 Tax=Culicoides sonorensis TaxID=179676 RepID=A0A336KVQ7_CULSO